jgi:hypothetical protein
LPFSTRGKVKTADWFLGNGGGSALINRLHFGICGPLIPLNNAISEIPVGLLGTLKGKKIL